MSWGPVYSLHWSITVSGGSMTHSSSYPKKQWVCFLMIKDKREAVTQTDSRMAERGKENEWPCHDFQRLCSCFVKTVRLIILSYDHLWNSSPLLVNKKKLPLSYRSPVPRLKPFELLFFCFHTLASKKWARHWDTLIGRCSWASQVTMPLARSTVMVGWGVCC